MEEVVVEIASDFRHHLNKKIENVVIQTFLENHQAAKVLPSSGGAENEAHTKFIVSIHDVNSFESLV